ncbi:hypothetical protein V8E36_002893 [Tilletia maclaganii]
MPLIVKLKRPGGGTGTAAGAASTFIQQEDENPITPTNEYPPVLAGGPTTPALAPTGMPDENLGLGVGAISTLAETSSEDGAYEVAMDEEAHEPMSIKVESEPRTPDLARSENIKSPIDTAMRDSTPITAKAAPLTAVSVPSSSSSVASALASTSSPAAAVDILIAPACLQHRYVRSHDLSAIVERPERLRAVVLGIAAAIGRAQHTHIIPEARSGAGSGPGTVKREAGWAGGDDDLASRLQGMNLDRARRGEASSSEPSSTSNAVNVWLCNRSLELNPPDPAVAFVHAHPDEVVEPSLPQYAIAQGLSFDRCVRVKSEAASTSALPLGYDENSGVTFASYLAELCRTAPGYPPDRGHDDPDRTIPGPHPSEVPVSLPQGDLYLRGISALASGHDRTGAALTNGGSGEAIQHALGACAEAVDRVVLASQDAASTASSGLTDSTTLESQHLSLLHLPSVTGPSSPTAPTPGPSTRNFVLTRPPGHHCSGNQPAGFCWASNAVVAAAHAYIRHGIDRVIILDIDLHHGNGTQALAWRINSETLQADAEREAKLLEQRRALHHAHSPKAHRHQAHAGGRKSAAAVPPPSQAPDTSLPASEQPTQLGASLFGASSSSADATAKQQDSSGPPARGLKIFYGSLHDIESYPCETGDPELVRDASTCIEGAHGQWTWNVHLDSYTSEADFNALYTSKYSILFSKARAFARSTSAAPSQTLILVSAGFDACTHEYASMSRHGRSVPVSFYSRFARDVGGLGDEVARGKVVSVLEGGYSDRALCSAALGFVGGLAGYHDPSPALGSGESEVGAGGRRPAECAEWWDVEALLKLEKGAKKLASSGGASLSSTVGTNSATASPAPVAMRKAAAPTAANPAWLQSAMAAFATMEREAGLRSERYGMASSSNSNEAGSATGAAAGGGTGRVLRDRSKAGRVVSGAVEGSPAVGRVKLEGA